jgi:hypothetical protein
MANKNHCGVLLAVEKQIKASYGKLKSLFTGEK